VETEQRDRIGDGERATQRRVRSEVDSGERFVQAFTQVGSRAGMILRRRVGQSFELAPGERGVVAPAYRDGLGKRSSYTGF